MASIVVHRVTQKRYVIVGAGSVAWSDKNLEGAGSGYAMTVTVSDNDGELGWFHLHELKLESVDGKPPSILLRDKTPYR